MKTFHRDRWIVGVYQVGLVGRYVRFIPAGESLAGLDIIQSFASEQEARKYAARRAMP